MIVLGVTHPVGEDNAAAIIVDGELVAMVEEERLNRVKHAPFTAPERSIDWCLEQAGCTLEDVDVIAIGFSDADSVLKDALAAAARRRVHRQPVFKSVRDELRDWRRVKFFLTRLDRVLGMPTYRSRSKKVMFVRHHMAHAASSFLLSGFENANVISLDGSGGQDAGLIGVGRGTEIEAQQWVDRETSWGVMYERYTTALGFRAHNDEGKVMGLAAYGDHGGEILPFIEMDGPDGLPVYDPRELKRAVSTIRPRDRYDTPINGYHEHLAAKLQYSLEQVLARITEVMHRRTGLTDVCLAGGTALNCSANGKLIGLPHVERLYVQPAASDSGTALGAAAYAYTQLTGKRPSKPMDHAYWGPSYDNDQIRAVLDLAKVPYRAVDDVAAEAARLVSEDKIVGWFQGRMEIGPRALGARSILANPTNEGMKDLVNKNVKFREPWRPFAPSLLAEAMPEYFGTEHPSPFMILAFEARPETRDKIPATLHVDNTGRPQTVTRETNEPYWALLTELRQRTGVPVVLNTSFNVDSEPIVCSPRNALATFHMCGLDALAIGDFVLEKRPS